MVSSFGEYECQISKSGKIEFYLCWHGSREVVLLKPVFPSCSLHNHTGAVLNTGICFFNDLSEIVPKYWFYMRLSALWKYLKDLLLSKCLKCVWNMRTATWRKNVEKWYYNCITHNGRRTTDLSFLCVFKTAVLLIGWTTMKCLFQQQQKSHMMLEILQLSISLLVIVSSFLKLHSWRILKDLRKMVSITVIGTIITWPGNTARSFRWLL